MSLLSVIRQVELQRCMPKMARSSGILRNFGREVSGTYNLFVLLAGKDSGVW